MRGFAAGFFVGMVLLANVVIWGLALGAFELVIVWCW